MFTNCGGELPFLRLIPVILMSPAKSPLLNVQELTNLSVFLFKLNVAMVNGRGA